MGMGPFGTMHVARVASDAGWGTGVANTSVQVGVLVLLRNLSLTTDFAGLGSFFLLWVARPAATKSIGVNEKSILR